MTQGRPREALRDTVLLGVVSLVVRAIQLGRPLWKDERITRRFITDYGPLDLVHVIPRLQPHFPPYYLLLDGLTAVTGAVVAGRVVSVVAGALVPVVAYWWVQAVRDTATARGVAGLLVVSPVLVMQSYWLRMYALLAVLVVGSWWRAWRYLHGGRAWPYALAAAGVVSLHPFGFVVAVAQLAWLTVEQYLSEWRPGFPLVAGSISLAVTAVVALLAVRAVFHVRGFGPVYSLHPSYADMPVVRAAILPVATLTGTHYTPVTTALAGLVTAGLAVQVVRVRYWRTPLGRLALCWIAGPMVLLLAAQTVLPVLQLKYVAWLAPPVALLAVDTTERRASWPVVVLACLAVLGLFLGVIEGKTVSRVAIYNSGVLQKL